MLFLIQEGAQTARSLSDNPAGMTTPGWIFISIAWTAIITVVIFCYRKVIQKAFERRQRKSLESLSLREDVGDEKVNK